VSFLFYTLLTKRARASLLYSNDRLGGWNGQGYDVPQNWITTPNTFDWYTGVQDHIVPNNYSPPKTHVGWLNPVMSAPLGGFELSRNDAALQDVTSYSSTTVPEFGYTGRLVIRY
jgi:hypothetical protein